MALTRRGGNRVTANIWPGFVDAMTALLLVLFFVLSIFMIVQFVLRDQVVEKDRELDDLSGQINQLADALGLEQQRAGGLEDELTGLSRDLATAQSEAAEQAALIATLSDQRDVAQARIASFEEQVAGLLAANRDLTGSLDQAQTSLARTEENLAALEAANAETLSQNEAMTLALAQARSEIDDASETARLAAARREALEAMIADLRQQSQDQSDQIAAQAEALTEAEAAKLADAAAAEALRERLQNSSAELTAMSLRLEQERQRAEETLTLLAAARAARNELATQNETLTNAQTELDQTAALLALAQQELSDERELSTEAQRQVELLNQQTGALNNQLRSLQSLLDDAKAREEADQVRLETLGSDLNTALARVAQEQRALAQESARRAELEEAERKRLEEEAKDLQNYRSEFFGRVREILGDREGIEIVGDRFVFSSEVLFDRGSADLGALGQRQLAEVASVIREIQSEIPEGIQWILRVDGHTDNIPIRSSQFADNWELSQARALSVVKYLITRERIPAQRLSANGFGEFQPIDAADTSEARARNRRIELKFTER